MSLCSLPLLAWALPRQHFLCNRKGENQGGVRGILGWLPKHSLWHWRRLLGKRKEPPAEAL